LQNLINRVTTLEASKQSGLKSDLYQLQSQLDEIQTFVQRVSSVLASQCVITPEQQRFIGGADGQTSAFVELLAECDYLSAKPFKTSIELDANEMRRDVWDMVQHERRNEEMQRIIDAKNAQIERLIRERDEIRRQKEIELEQLSQLYLSTKMELFHWVKLKGGTEGALLVNESVAGHDNNQHS
jgi:CII-binding regulator of phage lambda lysogenization HflD